MSNFCRQRQIFPLPCPGNNLVLHPIETHCKKGRNISIFDFPNINWWENTPYIMSGCIGCVKAGRSIRIQNLGLLTEVIARMR
ncbi:MAG TPA: hypothetical protein DDW76_10055 [Cyanobacteria bacterium UBA11369]|nr:hypothetical protein [Cyanobacteria bacterium UBA11371]HBE30302.1 hypothetical protein [Cyanobacteria bacterium UBA11368]HBE49116.1 hypothetical protein [Cyanobacteria bacterium UBA11369]